MMRFACLAALSLMACTSGPDVSAHWSTTENWGDGNCNEDFIWWDEVQVAVSDPQTTIANESYHCNDGGFDVGLPQGATNVDVRVTVIQHQDQDHTTTPLEIHIAGPIDGDIDLGKLTLPVE